MPASRSSLRTTQPILVLLIFAFIAGCGGTSGGEPDEFTLTLRVEGPGSADGGGDYEEGDEISVASNPVQCSAFTEWTGPDAAECATGIVEMNRDKSCTAQFVGDEFEVALPKGGTGDGAVSGDGLYTCGDMATVDMTAAAGSVEAGWSGPDRALCDLGTFEVATDVNCTALFNQVQLYNFIVATNGTGGGVVSDAASGISCGANCEHLLSEGTSVTVTAIADAGSSFVEWDGCSSENGDRCTVLMSENRMIVATFDLNAPQNGDVAFSSEAVIAGPNPKQLDFFWAVSGTTGLAHYVLEVNPDGASGFTPVDIDGDGDFSNDTLPASATTTRITLPLHLTDFNNARYQIVARGAGNVELARSGDLFIDDNGNVDDIRVEELIGYFKASNTAAVDQFATSVSLSADGNTLAVGAIGEDSGATGINGDQSDNLTTGAGAVYVFSRTSDGTWSQQAYVKASNTQTDGFGGSVSLSADGNTLAVGAVGERSGAIGIDGDQSDNSVFRAGVVYVFGRDAGGAWSQQAYVKASNTGREHDFGSSVSLSDDGNTLAVGAVREDSTATGINGDQNSNGSPSGAVYVFGRDADGIWSQQAYMKASNTDFDDLFATSLSLSANGDTLAVGAIREDSVATGIDGDQNSNGPGLLQSFNSGAVYVFSRAPGGVWSQQAYLKASNTDANDWFGTSVSLSDDGNTLAVGAPLEESGATGINGDQSDNSMSTAGAVYVFSRAPGDTWSQQAYVKASNTENDKFGSSVSLAADGDWLAVGAEGENGGTTGINGDQSDSSGVASGAVYVFGRAAGSTWSQQAYVKASNTDVLDFFGSSVSLSADASTLAVGSRSEKSSATGINGDQSVNSVSGAGAVYLY